MNSSTIHPQANERACDAGRASCQQAGRRRRKGIAYFPKKGLELLANLGFSWSTLADLGPFQGGELIESKETTLGGGYFDRIKGDSFGGESFDGIKGGQSGGGPFDGIKSNQSGGGPFDRINEASKQSQKH